MPLTPEHLNRVESTRVIQWPRLVKNIPLLNRLQLMEVMDEPWCPRLLRQWMTDYLAYTWRFFNFHQPVKDLLLEHFREQDRSLVITDLCSGSGGPARALASELRRQEIPFSMTLTDIHRPDETSCAALGPGIQYWPKPVDAKKVPQELRGVHTIFAAFHHFRPRDAQEILSAAAQAGQDIAIFEITDRKLLTTFLTLINTTVVLLLLTPMIRPFSWRRLFFTYIVPAIPLTLSFDAIVSCLRTYAPEELRAMTRAIKVPNYEFTIGRRRASLAYVSYVIGKASIPRSIPIEANSHSR